MHHLFAGVRMGPGFYHEESPFDFLHSHTFWHNFFVIYIIGFFTAYIIARISSFKGSNNPYQRRSWNEVIGDFVFGLLSWFGLITYFIFVSIPRYLGNLEDWWDEKVRTSKPPRWL